MSGTITEEDARYAFGMVERICREAGPGLPGVPQERERAAIIRKELEAHLGAGNVAVEEFTVAPGAFLGWTRICALPRITATRQVIPDAPAHLTHPPASPTIQHCSGRSRS
jgi:hypothetical protein